MEKRQSYALGLPGGGIRPLQRVRFTGRAGDKTMTVKELGLDCNVMWICIGDKHHLYVTDERGALRHFTTTVRGYTVSDLCGPWGEEPVPNPDEAVATMDTTVNAQEVRI